MEEIANIHTSYKSYEKSERQTLLLVLLIITHRYSCISVIISLQSQALVHYFIHKHIH